MWSEESGQFVPIYRNFLVIRTAVMLWDGDHKYLIDILTPTRNDTFALRIQNSQVNA